MLVEHSIIHKYFDNTASETEQQLVIQWLTDTNKRAEVLKWLEEYWQATKMETMTPPLFENILQKARERDTNTAKLLVHHKRKQFRFMVAAACTGFLALGIWMGFFMRKDVDHNDQTLIASAETKKGERTQIKLSDGSEVFLNGDSKLFFEKDAITKSQIIYLEGEAFFSQIQESTPLVIKTKDIVTTAKGAQFNISAFPADSLVKVSVNKGKAEVKKNTEPFAPLLKLRPVKMPEEEIARKQPEERETMPLVKLLPSLMVREKQAMTFDKKSSNGDLALTTQHDTRASTWKDGILSFQNASKAEIADKLERWFGISINFNIDQELLPLFTKEFNNMPLQDVLQVLSKELGVIYKFDGNKYVISKE